MAKKNNDRNHDNKGHGNDDLTTPPGPVVADPGARNLADPDWVRRDRMWKEQQPVEAYS